MLLLRWFVASAAWSALTMLPNWNQGNRRLSRLDKPRFLWAMGLAVITLYCLALWVKGAAPVLWLESIP